MTATFKTVLTGSAMAFLSACTSTPFSSDRDISEQCSLEMSAARTAVRLRELGKSQTELAAMLPTTQADSSRLLRQMHVILEESFAHPQFGEEIYPLYRYQLCQRELRNQAVPANLQAVHSLLLDCQRRTAEQSLNARAQCIETIFASQAPPVRPASSVNQQD